jgi:hypothetical protein
MSAYDDLAAAIDALPVSEEHVPSAIDDFWIVIARGCILSWAEELTRDAGRSRRGLETARECEGEPTDEQVAGLEEAFWRIRAATEKVDALIASLTEPMPFARMTTATRVSDFARTTRRTVSS